MYYGSTNLYGRYYDPSLSRFTQPDFIIPDNFNPQDFNRYTYTRNNPLKYNDPSGHCAIVCTAIVGAIGGGIFAYGIQVWDNYQKYGMTMETFTQVDGGKIVAGVVGGAVFGATLGLAAPVIAGGTVAIAGTTGGTIIGAAGGGAIAGFAGGQSQRFAEASIVQAGSVLTGNGFDGEKVLHDAVAAGVLQQDAIVVDSTAGVVSGLVGTGLSKAFVRAGLIPESANRAIKGEALPKVIFMSRDKILFDLGRTRLYMPADSYDQMTRLLQAGLFEEVATLLSNLAAKLEAGRASDELQ
jgi:RHS repeat-associated protein